MRTCQVSVNQSFSICFVFCGQKILNMDGEREIQFGLILVMCSMYLIIGEQKQPGSHMVRVLKAVSLDRIGRRSEAIALADTVRKEVPESEHVMQTLALVYKAAGCLTVSVPSYAPCWFVCHPLAQLINLETVSSSTHFVSCYDSATCSSYVLTFCACVRLQFTVRFKVWSYN